MLYLLHGLFLLRIFSHFYTNTKEGRPAAKQSSCSSYMKFQLGTNTLKCYTVHVYCASLAANGSNTDISSLSFLHLHDLVLGVAAACPRYRASAPTLFYVSDNSYHIYPPNQHQNVLIYTTTVNPPPQFYFIFSSLQVEQIIIFPWYKPCQPHETVDSSKK